MSSLRTGPVLVPHDLSPSSMNAAWRGALVARDLGTSLRLLCVTGQDAARAAEPSLLQLGEDIGRHVGIDVEVDSAGGEPLAATVRSARAAALVAIGSRRGNPLRELVGGTQAERLIRLCRSPVLVVKRPPAASYRRVLAPVELGPAAMPVIATALRLARRPLVEVLHALDTREEIGMRACELPEAVLRQHRHRAAQRARAVLLEMISCVTPGDREAVPAVSFGDAAAVVLAREQAMRADLLVIGKRARGLLADFFLGSVTQRVLARSQADVLVLPQPARGARTLAIGSITTQAPVGI